MDNENQNENPANDFIDGLAEQPQDEAPGYEGKHQADETKQFDEAYVKELREENKRYRLQAKDANQRLHEQLVKADGRLQDPTDLPFDENHLADPDALAAAVEELITAKPHLKARRATGDIGAGNRGDAAGKKPFDLIGHIRGR